MKKKLIWMLAAILTFCGATTVQAQVMKAADLEKYAKERYGDKVEEALRSGIVGNEDDDW